MDDDGRANIDRARLPTPRVKGSMLSDSAYLRYFQAVIRSEADLNLSRYALRLHSRHNASAAHGEHRPVTRYRIRGDAACCELRLLQGPGRLGQAAKAGGSGTVLCGPGPTGRLHAARPGPDSRRMCERSSDLASGRPGRPCSNAATPYIGWWLAEQWPMHMRWHATSTLTAHLQLND
jgi:hypothetical protein